MKKNNKITNIKYLLFFDLILIIKIIMHKFVFIMKKIMCYNASIELNKQFCALINILYNGNFFRKKKKKKKKYIYIYIYTYIYLFIYIYINIISCKIKHWNIV